MWPKEPRGRALECHFGPQSRGDTTLFEKLTQLRQNLTLQLVTGYNLPLRP